MAIQSGFCLSQRNEFGSKSLDSIQNPAFQSIVCTDVSKRHRELSGNPSELCCKMINRIMIGARDPILNLQDVGFNERQSKVIVDMLKQTNADFVTKDIFAHGNVRTIRETYAIASRDSRTVIRSTQIKFKRSSIANSEFFQKVSPSFLLLAADPVCQTVRRTVYSMASCPSEKVTFKNFQHKYHLLAGCLDLIKCR